MDILMEDGLRTCPYSGFLPAAHWGGMLWPEGVGGMQENRVEIRQTVDQVDKVLHSLSISIFICKMGIIAPNIHNENEKKLHVTFVAWHLADSWHSSNDCRHCQGILKCRSVPALQVKPVCSSCWEELSMSQAGGNGLEGPF